MGSCAACLKVVQAAGGEPKPDPEAGAAPADPVPRPDDGDGDGDSDMQGWNFTPGVFPFLDLQVLRSRPYQRVFKRPMTFFKAFFPLFLMGAVPKHQKHTNLRNLNCVLWLFAQNRKTCKFFFQIFQFSSGLFFRILIWDFLSLAIPKNAIWREKIEIDRWWLWLHRAPHSTRITKVI